MNKKDSSLSKKAEAGNDPVLIKDLMQPVTAETVFFEDSQVSELLQVYTRHSDILSFYVTDSEGQLLGQIGLVHVSQTRR